MKKLDIFKVKCVNEYRENINIIRIKIYPASKRDLQIQKPSELINILNKQS